MDLFQYADRYKPGIRGPWNTTAIMFNMVSGFSGAYFLKNFLSDLPTPIGGCAPPEGAGGAKTERNCKWKLLLNTGTQSSLSSTS